MIARLSLSCGFLLALAAAGCASSSLATKAPTGVNLSGDWVLNASLSDDTEPLGELEKASAKRHHHKDGDSASDAAAPAVHAPPRMSIKQEGDKLVIQTEKPREYSPGAQSPCGSEERCSAGWRGSVFTVELRPAGHAAREETYALDGEGHLIVEILSGKVDVKLAYDRARG